MDMDAEQPSDVDLNDDRNFSEALYIRSFPDVAYAVARGRFQSGFDHFSKIGRSEIASGRRKNVFRSRDDAVSAVAPESLLADEIGDEFFEELYLELNPDVAAAVSNESLSSGSYHWTSSGWYERANEMRPLIDFMKPQRPFHEYMGNMDPSGRIDHFGENLYRLLYPDLAPSLASADAGQQQWRHHGRYEARVGPGLARKLRRAIALKEFSKRPIGFNIYGPFVTDSGLGTAARSMAKAVKAAGFAVDLWCFTVRDGEVWPASHHAQRKPRFSINLICGNADLMVRLFAAYPEHHFDDAYNIAIWQWELAAFRPDWFYEFEGVNEIWTNSEFQLQAIGSIAPIPVRKVHLPVVPNRLSREEYCDDFALPKDKYKFFLSFDVGSTLSRKNPFAAVSAFLRHHQDFSDSHLTIKFHGSEYDASTLRGLLQKIGGHPAISVIGAKLNMVDYAKLRLSCDCLLSPHRSEGFGLQIAEFMARGKSVIATAYSGVCDFFDESVGYPIEYDLIELETPVGPYRKGSIWAEPRLDSLVEQMALVRTNRSDAKRRANAAMVRMKVAFSLEAIGQRIQTVVAGLHLNASLPAYLAGVTYIPGPPIEPSIPPTWSAASSDKGLFGPLMFSFVIPVYNVPGDLLRECLESIWQQSYINWEICICNDASTRQDTLDELNRWRGISPFIKIVDHDRNGGISAATNTAIHMAAGHFIVLTDNDDVVMPNALEVVNRTLQSQPDTEVLYTDEIKIDEAGGVIDHFYKPDWSPEHLESVMYALHMLVVKKSLLLKIGGFRDVYTGAQDYDLMLRCSRATQNIVHVPAALYKWRAIPGSAAAVVDAKPTALQNGLLALKDHVAVKYGPDASVDPGLLTGTFRVRRPLKTRPPASLLILTANGRGEVEGRGQICYVEHFVASIVEKTAYPHYEITVVDDGKLSAAQVQRLESAGARVIDFCRSSDHFNYAEKANFAISQARYENLVLLNDDMEVIREDWLESLLELSTDPGIGGVGARLLHADRSVQHVGMVLGVLGGATHIYHSYPEHFVGYNGFTHLIRNYSCVTAACLATRKSVMSAIRGFDTRFTVDYNDVDLCLRLGRAGYRIAYTPYAELFHFENSTARRSAANPPDVDLFVRTWQKLIDNDPYYNVNLSRNSGDFALRG